MSFITRLLSIPKQLNFEPKGFVAETDQPQWDPLIRGELRLDRFLVPWSHSAFTQYQTIILVSPMSYQLTPRAIDLEQIGQKAGSRLLSLLIE